MPRHKVDTVEELFMLAGGLKAMENITGASFWTLVNWKRHGIPMKYWDSIVDNLNTSVSELYHMSKKAKENDAK